MNGGTCVFDGSCMCPTNFAGNFCELASVGAMCLKGEFCEPTFMRLTENNNSKVTGNYLGIINYAIQTAHRHPIFRISKYLTPTLFQDKL